MEEFMTNHRIVQLLLIVLLAGCATTPAERGANLKIADPTVLGATYVVCDSEIKWDGVTFTIEDLETTGQSTIKEFTIGKLDYKPTEIHKLDTLALSIVHMFQEMCSSTKALENQPQALAEYVKSRNITAHKLFSVLNEFENINKKNISPEKAIEKQEQILKNKITQPEDKEAKM